MSRENYASLQTQYSLCIVQEIKATITLCDLSATIIFILVDILSLSNSHNNVASIERNQGDKSHRVIVA